MYLATSVSPHMAAQWEKSPRRCPRSLSRSVSRIGTSEVKWEEPSMAEVYGSLGCSAKRPTGVKISSKQAGGQGCPPDGRRDAGATQ
jgi:hypothetical protein